MAAIAFIHSDAKGQPYAPRYYRTFPQEPIPETGIQYMTVSAVKPVPDMTVMNLLKSIMENAEPGQEILFVSHGNDQGPSIPLIHGNTAFLQQNVLNVLERYEQGLIDTQSASQQLMLSTMDFDEFWKRVQAVRALQLKRVELRACNVGSNRKSMDMLKHFFACASFCAPKDLDVFATIAVNPGPTAIQEFTKRFRNTEIGGTAPHRHAVHVDIGTVDINAAFESRKAVTDWVSTHLPPRGLYTTGEIPAHGTIPSVGKKEFVWAGEKEYRSLLVQV